MLSSTDGAWGTAHGQEAAGPDEYATLAAVAFDSAGHLHRAGSLEDKISWALARLRSATGADFALFARLAEGRATVAAAEGANPVELAGIAQDHIRELIGAQLATGRPRADGLRISARWPGRLGQAVRSASGTLHGGLILGHADIDHFTDLDGLILRVIAVHLGIAIDNLERLHRLTELEASQREVAHQLQSAVLPPVPSVEGAELGRHYLAADPKAPTGGDLYDLLVLPDGALHVAVVDVLGKGVAATKDALTITHALRLLVLEGCPLDALVERADRLLTLQNPSLMATVMVGHFTPADGTLQLAGGGHPPPLLIREGGQVSELNAPGVAIGWPGAGSVSVATVALERSDTVIFYTDGLVEATKDINAGLAALAEAAAETADYPATQLARVLIERALAGAPRRDDSLVVVLKRRLPPASDERQLGRFEHRFSPNMAAVPVARHLLSDWLERQPLDPAEAGDLVLVAAELCSNAVKASSGSPGSVILRATADGAAVVLEVEDDGPGFRLPEWKDGEPPSTQLEEGRGLYLVTALTDEIDVRRLDGKTIVRCVKRAVLGGRPV